MADPTNSNQDVQVVTQQPTQDSSSAPSDGDEKVTQQPEQNSSSAPSDIEEVVTQQPKQNSSSAPSDGDEVVTQQPKQDSSSGPSDGDEAVTQQPKQNSSSAPGDGDGDKPSFEQEGPSAEIGFDPTDREACVSAAAGCGSASKKYLDGAAKAEYVGPNVACVLNCSKFPDAVITDWTFELCSANYLFGEILCTLGLALDTKLIFTADGVEAQLMGTGMETSEGFAVSAFGSKVGFADKKKREKKWIKKKWKWDKKKKVKPEDGTNRDVDGDGKAG